MVRWRVMACVLVGIPGTALLLFGKNVPTTPTKVVQVERPSLEVQSCSPVLGGLRVAIKAMNKEEGHLWLTYSFQWVGDEWGFCFIRRWGGLNLQFWDAKGNRLNAEVAEHFFVSEDFAWRKVNAFDSLVRFQIPPGARFIAYELGCSGLITKRVPIPD